MSSTVTVSAGRNIGDTPMGDIMWEAFTTEIVTTVEATGHTVLFEGTGKGVWEGTVEQAFTIVATTDDVADTDLLTRWLAVTAHVYGQEAIAVTTGDTILAGMVEA